MIKYTKLFNFRVSTALFLHHIVACLSLTLARLDVDTACAHRRCDRVTVVHIATSSSTQHHHSRDALPCLLIPPPSL